jgi:hypothetical protein
LDRLEKEKKNNSNRNIKEGDTYLIILYYYCVILNYFTATEHNIQLIVFCIYYDKIAHPISSYRYIETKNGKKDIRREE